MKENLSHLFPKKQRDLSINMHHLSNNIFGLPGYSPIQKDRQSKIKPSPLLLKQYNQIKDINTLPNINNNYEIYKNRIAKDQELLNNSYIESNKKINLETDQNIESHSRNKSSNADPIKINLNEGSLTSNTLVRQLTPNNMRLKSSYTVQKKDSDIKYTKGDILEKEGKNENPNRSFILMPKNEIVFDNSNHKENTEILPDLNVSGLNLDKRSTSSNQIKKKYHFKNEDFFDVNIKIQKEKLMQKLKKQENREELYRIQVKEKEEQRKKENEILMQQKMIEKQLKDNYEQDEKIIRKHEMNQVYYKLLNNQINEKKNVKNPEVENIRKMVNLRIDELNNFHHEVKEKDNQIKKYYKEILSNQIGERKNKK